MDIESTQTIIRSVFMSEMLQRIAKVLNNFECLSLCEDMHNETLISLEV